MQKSLLILTWVMSGAGAPQPEQPKATEPAREEQAKLGFFITSRGPGDGANLGGLVGAGPSGNQPAVNARDRIGGGPNPTSWNASHGSRGCSQDELPGTGGNGFF